MSTSSAEGTLVEGIDCREGYFSRLGRGPPFNNFFIILPQNGALWCCILAGFSGKKCVKT